MEKPADDGGEGQLPFRPSRRWRIRSSSSFLAMPSAALTWPWGRDLVMGRSSEGSLTAVPPLRRMYRPSMTGVGRRVRLATVLLRILFPSLQASLRRMTL